MHEYQVTVKLMYNGKHEDITFVIMGETYEDVIDKIQRLIDPRIRIITGMEALAI